MRETFLYVTAVAKLWRAALVLRKAGAAGLGPFFPQISLQLVIRNSTL